MDNIYESYMQDVSADNIASLMYAEPLVELANWFEGVKLNEQLMMNVPIAHDQIAKASGVTVKQLLSPQHLFNLPSVAAIKTYIAASLKFIKFAALATLSGAAIAQLLGWMFIGLAKLINKNVKKENDARQALVNSKVMKKLKSENLSDEMFIKRYKELKKDIVRKLNKEIPLKSGEKWSIILDKVGMGIKGKYGTTVFALAGLFLYGNLAAIPIIPAAEFAVSGIPIG